MVSVKECCCGCSLRTGSLILLWISLVLESLNIICHFFFSFVVNVITSTPVFSLEDGQTALKLLSGMSIIFLIESFFSAIVCLCGLIGIYKNIPQYLTFGVCYFGYEIGRNVTVIYVLMCDPTMGSTLVLLLLGGSKSSNFNHADAHAVKDVANGLSSAFIFTYILGCLFFSLLLTYFFIVVKSCRDAMRKDAVDRGANKTFDANALTRLRNKETDLRINNY